ncbi:MAG: hypothetical protein M1814_002350 [Vezdaea aestivalis]|nr:MAG: hypothetical protein M1814_002350 [Vezdaea aestivalis]
MQSPDSPPAPISGHRLPLSDPDNPINWTLYNKIYASTAGFMFAFTAAFGITCYTTGILEVMKQFEVSMTASILGLSLYLFGIVFAPIITPHLSERYGRTVVYLVTYPIFMLFILGAGFSKTFGSLMVCRFFAGMFAGPSLVLIEGTFADVWHPDVTLSYYAALALAAFTGTGCGPLIGGFVIPHTSWRWTQWLTLMLALATFLFGVGMPETYGREIMRRRAKKQGVSLTLRKADSGDSFGEMASATLIEPIKMLVTEPLVMGISLYAAFLFGTVFQFFISIPVVLNMVYKFSPAQVGLAFISAIGASILAALASISIDQLVVPRMLAKRQNPTKQIEYRLIPGMVGSICLTASFFWVGWTAAPTFASPVPITGTALYVFGNMSILISAISYLFDAYPPLGTLSALTAAACLRLIVGGIIPLVIIQMIMGLTGAWALSLFGFIAATLMPTPFLLYHFGARLRANSRYAAKTTMGAFESGEEGPTSKDGSMGMGHERPMMKGDGDIA